MTGYKSPEVYQELKSAQEQLDRLDHVLFPVEIQGYVYAASTNIRKAVQEYERLKEQEAG